MVIASSDKVRQAVVVIHGMGEQRPLDTLNEFINAGLEPDQKKARLYYSRPDEVTDSYEARRYLAPPRHKDNEELRAQTEFFEYHWAHLMQGNRLDDLWPTFRRILLSTPAYVPSGLRVIWALFWGLIIATVLLLLDVWRDGRLDLAAVGFDDVIRAVAGGGLVAIVLAYIVRSWLPSWLSSSFVDVVRYLDTSPRSYQVRRDVRAGIVELLAGLHAKGRYQRIIIVAHSLGSYIGYDAISYLWGQMNDLYAGNVDEGNTHPKSGAQPGGLAKLEEAAAALDPSDASDAKVMEFQEAQKQLWLGLRAQGNPWLVTDFISVGSPLYMADRVYTTDRSKFKARVSRLEFPTCPPENEQSPTNNVNSGDCWYSWNNRGRRVLHHGAPFAVVRWTNMWFPHHLGIAGDWFGGPLQPLFGQGVRDIKLRGNRPRSLIPGWAHALYYHFPDDVNDDSVTRKLRAAMDLASSSWLKATLQAPLPNADSGKRLGVSAQLPPPPQLVPAASSTAPAGNAAPAEAALVAAQGDPTVDASEPLSPAQRPRTVGRPKPPDPEMSDGEGP